MALSAVQGAGCSGTWVFRVTHDVETDEVWFQSSLAQRAGALGVTLGGDQVMLLAGPSVGVTKCSVSFRLEKQNFSTVLDMTLARI